MSGIGQPERATQSRVITLFRDELGYRYLGDWSNRPANSNIQEDLLTAYLTKAGYAPEQISRAIYLLRTEADNTHRSLYDNNKAVYSMLRYGVPVKVEAGKVTETVKVIKGKYTLPELKDGLGVDPHCDIDIIEDGVFRNIKPDEIVKIKEGMEFISRQCAGGAS